MNRVRVTLHIIPTDVEHYELEDFDAAAHGKVLSNTKELKVNQVADGYSIVYDGDIFERLNVNIFGANVIKLFQSNLPTAIIDMGILYHYDLGDDDDAFEEEVAEKIFELDAYLSKIKNPNFKYHRSESILETMESYKDAQSDDSDDLTNDNDLPWDDRYDDDEESDDPFDFLDRLEGSRKKSKRKPKFESYGKSKVIRNAKNPKRAYRRHGILIASDKDDLKKDERIIKEFLKDFIPGGSEWKKDLRRDVLKRWMRMYAVSKKNLKQLEREYRRTHTSKRNSSVNADKVLDFTRRMFNSPTDRWSDPSK